MQIQYITCAEHYYPIYYDMAKQPHLLIAGATGSGKSVVVNGIIQSLLANHSPITAQFILIDPKRVELCQYKQLPHVLKYASEPGEPGQALRYAVQLMEARFSEMQREGVREYRGGHLYIVIDELADLMLTDKKIVQPLLQRLGQLGRAAHVHLIACTQCPLASVIPTAIKCNLDSRLGLRTRSAQDSRNILGLSGCETLPRYGQGYYMTPEGVDRITLPLVSDDLIVPLIRWWTGPDCKRYTA